MAVGGARWARDTGLDLARRAGTTGLELARRTWSTRARGSLPETAARVRASVRRRLLFANAAGGVAVLTFVQLSSGKDLAPAVPLWLQLVGPLVPAVLLVLPGYLWGHRAFTSTVSWAFEGRSPSLAERFAVLREPWRQAVRPLLFWFLATLIYAGITALFGASLVTVSRVVVGTLLGGVTTCALAYQLIERSFRPLFAYVLDRVPDSRPHTPGIRLRLMLTWAVGSGVPLLALALVLFLDGNEIPPYALAVLALAGLAAGLIATIASAQSVAEPLDALRHALARVRDDDLDVGLVVDDGGEVGEVQAGFNRMVDGLRERRQLEDLFGRHVGQVVAEQALERGTGLRGEEADASVVFVDIVGSTAMAEVLTPDDVVALLNDFFEVVVRAVDDEGGWVNKFEGDGALCVFGVPDGLPDHADRALRAARSVHRGLSDLGERHPGLEAGIGVSSGRVVAGNVGTEARYEYTVIGPTVNEAARLTDVAKGRVVKVLASSETVRRATGEAHRWVEVGTVPLRGRSAPTVIFGPLPDEPVPATGERAEPSASPGRGDAGTPG
ncbi:MAG TPA: adenylate/guanylate cyclase domain-containing protein [Acidimicrobiales bacterium]|nr:adenylate/guanylate cyclase domain-containing protein [Acidimicrobiales bacterium]